MMAYCADKNFPVECYQIPRKFKQFDILNELYNQIGASNQLLRSKYF